MDPRSNKPSEPILAKPIPTPITETAEFKAAVSAAADQLRQEILSSLGNQPAAVASPAVDAMEMMRELATQIATMVDQGSPQSVKRERPEVLAKRRAAAETMAALILASKREGDSHAERHGEVATQEAGLRPRYKVVAQTWLAERVIHPFTQVNRVATPTEIYWSGPPSHALRPLNDMARKIFAEFEASVGEASKIEKLGAKKFWVTAGGLTVVGEPPRHREVGTINAHTDELSGNAPRPESHEQFVHVLGTIAPPAKINMNSPGRPSDTAYR